MPETLNLNYYYGNEADQYSFYPVSYTHLDVYKRQDHAKQFTACVCINGVQQAQGEGKTKKEAEQNAACRTLVQMGILE